MTGDQAAPANRRLPGRRIERLAVSVLSALLPVEFRDRQRQEWMGDLMSLADSSPPVRGRYLIGAALTLPSLCRVVRGGRSADPTPIVIPAGVRETVARVLLFGLPLPLLSWLFMVPGRYLVSDVPGRSARGDYSYATDESTVWPFGGHTPHWLTPVWDALGWAALLLLFGSLLFAAVSLLGGAATLLLHRKKPVHLRTVALFGLATLGAIAVTGAVYQTGLLDSRWETLSLSGSAVLGVAAAVLGFSLKDLSGRSRIGLIALGFTAIAAFATFFVPIGQPMYEWVFGPLR